MRRRRTQSPRRSAACDTASERPCCALWAAPHDWNFRSAVDMLSAARQASRHMNIQRITLTGADEHTDIDQLVEFSDRFPQVELGLLYTVTPEGRPRYPRRDWLLRAATALSDRVAIHVCGGGARREMLD